MKARHIYFSVHFSCSACVSRTSVLSQGLGFNTSTLASLNVTIAPIGTRMNCSTFIRLQFQFCVATQDSSFSVYVIVDLEARSTDSTQT